MADKMSFNFKEFGNDYLITNDFGNFEFLTKEEFQSFLSGLNEEDPLYLNLYEKGFIKRDLSQMDDLVKRYASRKASLLSGPSLHIIVTTLRCNYNCIYCQASAKSMKKEGLDMDKKTAKKVVDRIFQTTNKNIVIEFQGGEPMANWEVVKFIINYARKKEQESNKEVDFSLVTNLSLMTDKKMNFLIEKRVGICTSLDGPKKVHNKNRPYSEGDSYKIAVEWINKYEKRRKKLKEKGVDITRINALVTISKFSLSYPKEIVDEYAKLGLRGIHLRPLSYLGYSSGAAKNKIGYSVDEFLDFWKKAVEYIVKLNNLGVIFFERQARIMLKKILTAQDPGYTDLSSPCGAIIGQVLYNYDGNLYTCDEGRMTGDDTFKIGHIDDVSYEEMIQCPLAQSMLSASTLENQACDNCVYSPYCGVCPVKNLSHYGTLFPKIKETEWCKLHTGQFDYLFTKLRDKKFKKVFNEWLN